MKNQIDLKVDAFERFRSLVIPTTKGLGIMSTLNKTIFISAFSTASAVLVSLGITSSASAAAIIGNGTIQLGVDDFGQLNVEGGTPSLGGTTAVGLRYLPTGAESTAPGCLCEGWGVADATTGLTGFANNASGSGGLTLSSFISSATTATSTVDVGGLFRVIHDFKPSAQSVNLYEALVTIQNIGTSDVGDLRYRRVMDWDVEPTAFNEFSTIQGGASASKVLFTSNDGFASSNPLAGNSDLGITGDFVDFGPLDHGALFDFGFGPLKVFDSLVFSIFYGAAGNETEALTALADVGAEVYSLGQPATGKITGEPNTFIFGFKGVGGTPLPPNPTQVPEPTTMAGLALVGLGIAGTRRKQTKASVKV